MEGYRDGLRVLVAGGKELERGVGDFARRFGKRLMSLTGPDVVLITGGREGGDAEAVKGAREELNGSDLERIVTFVNPTSAEPVSDVFQGTHLVRTTGRSRQRRRFAMVAAAHAVVAIGGKSGTPQIVELARALGIPVLPFPFTGGHAAELWTKPRDREEWCSTFFIEEDTRTRWLGDDAHANPAALAEEAAELTWRSAASECFVAMRYLDGEDPVWKRIQNAVHAAGLRAVRSDKYAVPGEVAEQMVNQIRRAPVVLAYLTDERAGNGEPRNGINPNVMYEVGFAHALERPVVLVADRETVRPIDIYGHQTITYADSDEFSQEISRQLKNARVWKMRAPRDPGRD
jgi:predicted Rossmann-fold nucleotide-binding protein